MQLLFNILITGGTTALLAIGFSIIYQAARFYHFTHGITYTIGAYTFFLAVAQFGIPVSLGILLSIAVSSLTGITMAKAIYLPLKRKGASTLIQLLTSLGIYIVLQNLISLLFGDDTKIISSHGLSSSFELLGARITPLQLIIILSCAVLLIVVSYLLKYSKAGLAIRAIADDRELAIVSGLDHDVFMSLAFGVGSGIAGLAGILAGLNVDLTPNMGMSALMMAMVVVIVGGIGNLTRISISALLFSTIQNLGAWYVGSKWQYAIAFSVLLIFLVIKTDGLVGKRSRPRVS